MPVLSGAASARAPRAAKSYAHPNWAAHVQVARLAHSPVLAAVATLATLLLVFFWTPLVTPNGYFLAVDTLQESALVQIDDSEITPRNALQTDPVRQLIPFLAWNKAEFERGALPLWNPYNASGVPHMANSHSAVFSVFSLPFYVLDWRWALILSAFMKLCSLGLFTYLFLRLLGTRQVAALLGATAFTFSGYSVVWINSTNPGAAIAAPAGLYFAELALQRPAGPSRWLALVGLTLGLTVACLAGHNETLFWAVILLSAYCLARLVGMREPVAWRVRRAAELAAAGVAALGLAAVQLVPFFEYVQLSFTSPARAHDPSSYVLRLPLAPLQAFPQLLGSPASSYYDGILRFGVNFNEANSSYIGLVTLFLAMLAVVALRWRRSSSTVFFALAAVGWVVYAYNVAGIESILIQLPGLRHTGVTRTHIVWLLSIAVLAGLGLDAVLRRALPVRAVLACGLTVLVGAMLGGVVLLAWAMRQADNSVLTPQAQSVVVPHVAVILASTLLAVVLAAGARTYRWVGVGVLLMVFVQTGLLLRDYTPTVDGKYFYPSPPRMRELTARVADDTILSVGEAGVPSSANLVYRLRTTGNYDVLDVMPYAVTRMALLGGPPATDSAAPTSLGSLHVFGVQWITATTGTALPILGGPLAVWSDGSVGLFQVPDSLPRYYIVGHAVPARDLESTIRLLRSPTFDARTTVSIETHDSAQPSGASVVAQAARVVNSTPTEAHLQVRAESAGWLVALQPHYPGWTAVVDGKPRPLYRANGAFSAVPIEPGDSDVVLRYEPLSVRIGLAVSIATLIAMSLATLAWARQARRSKPIFTR